MARKKRGERTIPTPALPILKQMLADTRDFELLNLFWSVHALQDDRADKVLKKFLTYPPQAASSDMLGQYAAYRWELETLITLMLNTPKAEKPGWLMKPLNTTHFNAMADLSNTLRATEDDQSRERIDVSNIMLEMHRIGHRQFQWQRGWGRAEDLYRYLFIYGQGLCAEYFEATNGLSIIDFVSVAFALYVQHREGPWTKSLTGLEVMGIDDAIVSKVMPLLSDEIWQVRKQSQSLLRKVEEGLGVRLPIIYQPSYLRVKPIIRSSVHDTYMAPLPGLIMMRATVGLYYDLIGGGTEITGDANKRFEEYARLSLKAYCPAFDPTPAVHYIFKKNPVDTPDVLLKKDGQIVAVFECKATKLTFEAQYGDDPVNNARNGYAQMSKGVFQLWKFFSHVRRGFIDVDVADEATCIVLTMDAWTQMGGDLRGRIIADAEKLVAEKDPEITQADKRYPIFCSIQDLDELLAMSSEEQLLAAFTAASEEKYQKWGVRDVRQHAIPALGKRKRHPFDLGELLPWWKMLPVTPADEGDPAAEGAAS